MQTIPSPRTTTSPRIETQTLVQPSAIASKASLLLQSNDLSTNSEKVLIVTSLPTVLDNLPENRAERLVILLNNLPSEDLCHIINDKIPPFLRIDKDVQEQRDKLRNFAKEFMDFNIDDLDIEIRQKLKELV